MCSWQESGAVQRVRRTTPLELLKDYGQIIDWDTRLSEEGSGPDCGGVVTCWSLHHTVVVN